MLAGVHKGTPAKCSHSTDCPASITPASEEPHLPSPDTHEATGEGAMRQAHKQAARA